MSEHDTQDTYRPNRSHVIGHAELTKGMIAGVEADARRKGTPLRRAEPTARARLAQQFGSFRG